MSSFVDYSQGSRGGKTKPVIAFGGPIDIAAKECGVLGAHLHECVSHQSCSMWNRLLGICGSLDLVEYAEICLVVLLQEVQCGFALDLPG